MIKQSLFFLLALLLGASVTAAQPSTVTFVLDLRVPIRAGWFDPATETVGLRGSQEPLSWNRTLDAADPEGDSLYTVTVAFPERPFGDQPVAYKVKVDGAANPNEGWEETPNHAVVLGDAPTTVERAFNASPVGLEPTYTGVIEEHAQVASAFLPPRDVFVYLPPCYADEPARRYPVLYLHDGQNVFDLRSVGGEWQVDETAQRLIEESQIEPVIIVGVANTADRVSEYTPTERTWHYEMERVEAEDRFGGRYEADAETVLRISEEDGTLHAQLPGEEARVPLVRKEESVFHLPALDITFTFVAGADGMVTRVLADKPPAGGKGPLYGRFLVEELKPFIDRTYRTRSEAAHTALGGSSLGGLITLALGLDYPGVFGQLLVVSPSVWWDDYALLRHVEELAQRTNQRLWLDMGTAEGDQMLADARRLRDALVAKGWTDGANLRYVEDEGAAHSETAWAARVAPMLLFLYGR